MCEHQRLVKIDFMPQSGTLELEIHSVPWKKTDFTPRYSGLGSKVDFRQWYLSHVIFKCL